MVAGEGPTYVMSSIYTYWKYIFRINQNRLTKDTHKTGQQLGNRYGWLVYNHVTTTEMNSRIGITMFSKVK